MKDSRTTHTAVAVTTASKWTVFSELVKFRLSLMVVMSALFGYAIAGYGVFNWGVFAAIAVGGFMITAAANILNEVLEVEYDALMKRTEARPLVTGALKRSQAVLLAGLFTLFGVAILAFHQPLAGLLGMISLVLYAFVYTPLKRYSPLSVFVGAIPGALPVLIGAIIAEGYFSSLALSIFAIQFIWQFPHFWAIGWISYDDYKKAGFLLLPNGLQGRKKEIGRQAFIFTLFLLPLTALLYSSTNISFVASLLIVVLSMGFIMAAFALYIKNKEKEARTLLYASLIYLPAVQLTLLIDLWI